jgi:hypothetical protein
MVIRCSRVAVRGASTALERTVPSCASAVDVARQHASMLTKGLQVGTSVIAGPGASQFMNREGMRTIFKMDVGQLEQEISKRKKDIRRGAPAWRPSSDLTRNPAMRGTVVLSILAAVALCGGALFFSGGKALVNHPMSKAHSSAKFVEMVGDKGGGATVCGACHTAGAGVKAGACESCHDTFKTRSHEFTKAAHDAHSCGSCQDANRATTDGALGARDVRRLPSEPARGRLQVDELNRSTPANQARARPDGRNPTTGRDARRPSGSPRSTPPLAPEGRRQTGRHRRNVLNVDATTKALTAVNNPKMSCFHCHNRDSEPINCNSCHGVGTRRSSIARIRAKISSAPRARSPRSAGPRGSRSSGSPRACCSASGSASVAASKSARSSSSSSRTRPRS